jgi:hypothetical protein
MEPQQVIVYRTKWEYDFYNNNGPAFMVMFMLTMGISFFIVFYGLCLITGKKNWNAPTWFAWVAGIVSCIAGLYVSMTFTR